MADFAKITALKEELKAKENEVADLRFSIFQASRKAKNSSRGPSGIGQYIKSKIKLGWTNEQILEGCYRLYPANNPSIGSISWYRVKVKREEQQKQAADSSGS
jgi:cell division septum initiation protein DivIVA